MSAFFTFAFAADTHVVSEKNRDWLIEDLAALQDVDCIVIGGDLTGSGSDQELCWYKEAVASSTVPVHSVFGGHDGNELLRAGAPKPAANFQRHLGPLWYGFTQGAFRFVVSAAEVNYLSPDQRQCQMQWLKDEASGLVPGEQLVVFQHCRTPVPHEIFPERHLKAVFTGHWHLLDTRLRGTTLLAGVTPLCQTGFMGLPRGYFRVTVEGERLSAEFVPLNARPNRSVSTMATIPQAVPPADIQTVTKPSDLCNGPGAATGAGPQAAPLKMAWQRQLPGFCALSAPAVSTGIVVVSTLCNPGTGGLVNAFLAEDGRHLWQVPLESGAQHTPVVYEQQVILLERDGRLAAFDLHSGGRLWEKYVDTGEERLVAHGFSVAAGRLFIRTNRRIAAVDISNHCIAWEAPLRHEDWMGPCGWPLPVGGRVFVPAMRGDGVSAFDVATGERVWQTGCSARGLERIVGGLACSRKLDRLFVSGFFISDPGGSDDRDSTGLLYALAAETGEIAWERPIGSYNYTTPVVVDDTLLVSDMINGVLWALDAVSGEEKWSLRTGAPLQCLAPRKRYSPGISAMPAVHEQTVYCCASDGYLYAVDLADGKVLSQATLGAAIASSPALNGQSIFVTTRDSSVIALTGS